MSKRVLFALLIVVMLMAAGCSTAAPQATTAPDQEPAATTAGETDATVAVEPAASGDCTLHILGGTRSYEGEEEVWNELFAAFEAEYGCKVEARWQGEWSDTPQQLETSRMAQEPVDIVYNSATLNYTMARSGILMDMTDLVAPFADRFADGMLDKYTIGGHVWAVPLSDSSTSTFFYNADLFKELGLAEPKTYADLLTISQKIKDEKGIMPLIHQGKEPWYWPMWFFETYAQTTGNQSIQDIEDFLSGKRQFTGEEEKAALDAITKFYTDGIMAPESMDTDNAGMRAAFLQGKAAMYYGGTWEVAPLRSSDPSFEIGIFQFPQMVDGVTPQHGGGPDNAWSIPSFAPAENLPMTVQFLEFITRPENAQKILNTYAAMIPSIKGVTPVDDPFAEELNSEYVPNTITYLDWIWPTEINDAIVEVIPAVMTGNMTTDQAVERVQKAYDTLVEEKQYSFDWWNTWADTDWQKVTPASIPQIEVK
jgi:raffinose/stachyose/melibiose transport system substrate-binding protein